VDLLSAWGRIENRQRAILLLAVGDLDPLKILGIPQILGSLLHIAVRAGDAHERCRESGGDGNVGNLCGRGHDGGLLGVGATAILVSITLGVRSGWVRTVLVAAGRSDRDCRGKPRCSRQPTPVCFCTLPRRYGQQLAQLTFRAWVRGWFRCDSARDMK